MNTLPGTAFSHLHVASGYSLRYGASTPDALVQRAADLGQSALALTDRDGLYGAVRFVRACRESGIRPVLGVDLAVHSSGLTAGRASGAPGADRRTPARGGVWRGQDHARVVLLAQGARGWASLCRLVSAAHLSGSRGEPVATFEQVAEHSSGLLLLLGPESELGRAITARRPDLADKILRQWRQCFDRVAVEVVSHLVPDAGASLTTNRSSGWIAGLSIPSAARLLGWSVQRQVPVILSNAVRHATKEQARAVDVLDSVRRLVPISGRHLDRGNSEGYLKSAAEMLFVAEQVAVAAGQRDPAMFSRQWLRRTAELADECALDPVADLGIGSVHVPELDVLMGGVPPPGVTAQAAADQLLRRRCQEGLHRVGYPGADAVKARERLEEELRTIATLGFGGYFLTVAEVVDLIRGMGVRVAARGSGAGSLVNYLLGISGVDPLRHGLLMERFLSPLRRALPDIDVDVESARRTQVYEKILNRFGGERCVCVSMMDTYRARHAIRDVGAALGMPPGEVDLFAKSLPHIRARDARAALADLPELRSSGFGRLAEQGRLDGFFDLVEALDGLPRHVALHPCGVLLSDSTLLDRTPIEASWLGFPMSQFDKDDVEEMGFLKLDVLGIRMQSAMAHSVNEIARIGGGAPGGADTRRRIDIDAIPRDDETTFELIRSARTLGCFQIESPGQRELVGKFAPETFDDLIIDISLFRPGPVKSDMVNPFLRARQGWAEPEYLHEDLRPVLSETAGVVVFHEQVIRIISVITGCSLAEADEIRRELGSPEGQQKVRGWFYLAARRRGYGLGTVEEVWDVLRAFASFGFCKAHAAAFALPTYQSVWLKAHHPAAFFAGVLTHDPGMYPKRLILNDARNFGIRILGVDVNESDRVYRVERVSDAGDPAQGSSNDLGGIRVPLSDVKGISAAEEVSIIAGRPYESLADFWHRAGVSRPTAEHLVLTGGFDNLDGTGANSGTGPANRRDLLLQVICMDRYTRSRGARGARRAAGREPAKSHAGSPGQDLVLAVRRQSQAPAAVRAPEDIPVQLVLGLADTPTATLSGLPDMTAGERVRAEVEILGMDVSGHVVSFYEPLLRDLDVVRARDLLTCRSRAEILVAGVKVATQTPPVRGGRRVVFLTLDDSTGPVDATFFSDAQGAYAATLFHSWMLLVRGHVRRTGPRGVSIRATGCWELGAVRKRWIAQGVPGVRGMLLDSPAGTAGTAGTADASVGSATVGQRRRVLVHANGFRVSAYSDTKPAGENVKSASPRIRDDSREYENPEGPPTKLWHSSPGSSGW
ncbi:MAG: DNA polymerase III subunit alpha [Candidatus Nanopelagicales bacterium]|nr:DNA polymerase III subunit alpha [Candidatus Nanopelagicales bacterium]MDZ4249385.1 DNA polymerase III subunit alpha [Candidatus Nanopelagicales bacterium]